MTRLVVDPLTRVEGHGRVELILKDGRLDDVVVRLLESPRLFEKLVVGRHYEDVPDLICRICAICSAVHKLTALQALEAAMGVVIPVQARLIRDLLLLGGHIQSHALHLFCLILPDLAGTPDILKLLAENNPLAKAGLELKAYGNQLQELFGGRVIHPVNPVFGGVNYRPQSVSIETLIEENRRWQCEWPALSANYLGLDNYPASSPVIGRAIATGLVERISLTGESLWHEQSGRFPAQDYSDLLGEIPRSDSHALDAAGAGGPFLTGALARARLAAQRGLPCAVPDQNLGIHANNFCQIQEISWSLQRVGELLEELLALDNTKPLKSVLAGSCSGTGTAVAEAPRGLLIHHYVVDEWGKIAAADIVTPTAINQRVMQAQILADLADETEHDRLREISQRIVRAYDPCISCAVHLLEI